MRFFWLHPFLFVKKRWTFLLAPRFSFRKEKVDRHFSQNCHKFLPNIKTQLTNGRENGKITMI